MFKKQIEIGRFVIEVETKKGGWLDEMYPHGADRKSRLRTETLIMPATKKESTQSRTIANNKQSDKFGSYYT